MCDVSKWLWEDERGGLSCAGEGGGRERELTCTDMSCCPDLPLLPPTWNSGLDIITTLHTGITRAGYWLFPFSLPITHSGWLSPSLLLTGNALNSPVIESELRYWNVFCMQVSKLRLKQPITQITGSIFITSQLKILEILLATISKVSGPRLREGRRPWGHFVTFCFARIFYKLKVENDNKHLKYSPKSGQYFFKI